MTPQATATQSRLNTALSCLIGVTETLKILADSFRAPFLQPISSTAQSLTVTKNKNECIDMVEQIYKLLYTIVSLYIESESGMDLSPNQLHCLGKFAETLNKVHVFVQAQQEKKTIRDIFRGGETSMLLKNCKLGLKEALDNFKASK
ncbi:hypothetical protein C8R43DRAFT_948297 [Mycena crocata]|nr:hypothetical protein C8R43DRAFT_948297 [Mycena crocata]